ncbi:MAG: hypothetical protein ACLPS1_27210 [Streptosporangiaceae bacterium]
MYGMGWKIPALSAVAGVVALTVGGAAIALAMHGTAGALLGAVPGALAAVAAGSVPALRDYARQRNERLEAARLHLVAIAETRSRGGQQSWASLLRPERAVVKFAGRESELEALRAWCAPEGSGAGKTRLALQPAAEFKAAQGRRRFKAVRGAWLVAAGREGKAVQPDLLAETHVTSQIAANPGLAQACLGDLSPGQAEQALTVLARAQHGDAGQIITNALDGDLIHLAIPAAQVAVQTWAGLGRLLADAPQDAPASLEALVDIAAGLPDPGVTLAQANLAVTVRVPTTDDR